MTPNRTIEFTTDQGTWISLDVSPDGKTIVFELLGDLYTLPIAGAKPRRSRPGWRSTVSQLFARRQDDRVCERSRRRRQPVGRGDADGSITRPLTKDKQSLFASPAWTPDGEYVLVSRQPQLPWGAFELWMYHIRGGSGVQVTKGKTKARLRPG